MATSPGYVQGFALNSSNLPIEGATIDLWDNTGNRNPVNLLATTTTNSAGYYNFNSYFSQFNDITNPYSTTTYQLTETAAGYSPSVTGNDIQTTINPASAIDGDTAISVTVENLDSQSINVLWPGGFAGDYVIEQLYASLAVPPTNVAGAPQNSGTQLEGQLALALTLTNNLGNVSSIGTFCSDLLHGVNQNHPYTVQPSTNSNTTTLGSTDSTYSVNLGEMGYLYNTYGTSPPIGQTFTSTQSAGLQLALWSLEYNQMPSSGAMTLATTDTAATPFVVSMSATDPIVLAANAYLATAYSEFSEDAYFLNLNTTTENQYAANDGQGMLCTDTLNFSNTGLALPSINTSQQPASATVGTSIADQATVSGGNNPTGTVTFNLYPNSSGTGTPLYTDANVPLVSGVATSVGYTATATGTDYWVATYNGDSNNDSVSSGTASEPVTVGQASPSIDTSQQPASATVGTSIADQATVSGGYNPTGTVTFNLYNNSSGTGTPLYTDADVALVSGVATSVGYTATATGTDYWVATYNGDSNNDSVSSGTASEPVTVGQASPSIDTSQQPASATVGSSIADKATVSGGYNPTGTVTFNLYNNSSGTGTPLYTDANEPLVNGVATSAGYTATATGTDYWVATYNGDSNNASVSSGTASEPVTVGQASPSIDTSQQPASATVGSSIADQATVSGGYNPTGTVTFNLYNNSSATGTPLYTDANVALVSGVATSLGYTATATGTDYWVATYNGDSNNASVSSGTASEPVTIGQASPSINTSQQPASATVGTSIADQATVSGGYNPTGTVTFNLYNNSSGNGTPLYTDANVALVSGVATSVGYTATATGTDYWVATYNGDSNNASVSSGTASEPVTIGQASPSIDTSQQPASATVGTSVADQATVSGGYNPTGTVTFNLYNNSSGTGTPLYTDANVALVSGVATSVGYTATATGTDYWVATYNGDSNNASVSSDTASEPVCVTKVTPSISTSQQPATASVGTSIADQATVSGGYNPTGTVTFNLYNNSSGTGTPLYTDANVALVSGVATSLGYTATATGTDYWVATYNGDSNNASVSSGTASEPVCVTKVTPSISTSQQPATASVGSSIADQATVSGGYNPTGTVTFNLYNNSSGTGTALYTDANVALVSGVATSVGYTATATGTDYWVATYNGDSNNASVSSGTASEPVCVTKVTPSISTSQQPATASVGSSIADQATVSGGYNPTGTVTFNLYNNSSGTGTALYTDANVALVSGVATSVGYTATATGTDYWVATYNGDSNNASVSSGTASEPVCVTKVTPSISTSQQPATASVGSSIADQATVSGGYNPTGTVTFNLYNNSSGTGTALYTDANVALVSGVATSVGYTATATGTDYWVATYNGDSNNASVSSGTASEPVCVTKVTPSISTSQQPATASVGSSIADQATVSGGYNPTGTVTFNLYNNSSGTGTALYTDANVALVSGVATSVGYTATATGTDYWVATYNGDSNNASVSSGTASEPVCVTKVTPSISTSQQPATASVGSSIADKATVSGGYNPTGTVTFNLYNNSSGTGTALYTDANVALVSGVATSVGYTATATGTDYWVATYNGDSNNASVSSGTASEPVCLTKATPSISTSQQPATATVGSSIADKATVSGGYNPTGSVTFNLYTNSNGSGTPLYTDANVALVNGVATSVGYTATATGTDYWVATYNGDSNNASVSSGTASEPVCLTKATPSISTSQQPATATVGSSIADKATVSGGYNPTGTVTFNLYSNSNGSGTPLYTDANVTLVNGVATSVGYTATSSGTDYWVATYNGDSNNVSVTSGTASEPVSITKAGPQISTTPNETVVQVGTATCLTDTATLSGGYNETGTITFTLYLGSTKLDSETATVHGNGTYTTPNGYSLPANATAGIYQWDATYNGDGNNSSASDNNDPNEQVAVVNSCCNVQNVTFSVTTPGPNSTTTVVTDLRGNTQQGDTVTANFTVPSGYYDQISLVSYTAPEPTYNSGDADLQQVYQYETEVFGPGAHSLTVTLPNSFYQVDFVCGSVISTLGLNSNDFYSAQNRLMSADNGGLNPVGSPELSVSGVVFCDQNKNGIIQSNEEGIGGVTVTLTGNDAYGNSVTYTATTNAEGQYTIAGMPFSSTSGYTVTVTTPSGLTATKDAVGTVNGSTDGSVVSSVSLGSVVLKSGAITGVNYNFGMIGSSVCQSQCQTISYWCGSQGQSLINCLNGGSGSQSLGNWLAATCPNTFGNLNGCTNSQVASYCKTLSNGNSNQKACSQLLATAISAYATNSNLAGNAASSYGFTVTGWGVGSSVYNIGGNGSSLSLSNNTSYSVYALLVQADSQLKNGNSSTYNAVSSLFSALNQAGS